MRLARLALLGSLEHVAEDRRVLLEDVVRDGKVAFEPLDLPLELLGHVRHVRPLGDLVEELRQAQVAEPQQAGQADAVALHRAAVQRRRRGLATGHVHRTPQPVQRLALQPQPMRTGPFRVSRAFLPPGCNWIGCSGSSPRPGWWFRRPGSACCTGRGAS